MEKEQKAVDASWFTQAGCDCSLLFVCPVIVRKENGYFNFNRFNAAAAARCSASFLERPAP